MRRTLLVALLVAVACGSVRTDDLARRPDGPPAPLPDNPRPEYPDEARRQGIEGAVTLEIRVREDGSVDTVEVVDGAEPLAAAAVAAARKARYAPARRDGRPIAATVRQTMRFQLAAVQWELVHAQGSDPPSSVWFDSRRACQDAIALIPGARLCRLNANVARHPEERDAVLFDPRALTELGREPLPQGWWGLLVAPWAATTTTFQRDLPLAQWRVLAAYRDEERCAQDRARQVAGLQKVQRRRSGAVADEVRCWRPAP